MTVITEKDCELLTKAIGFTLTVVGYSCGTVDTDTITDKWVDELNDKVSDLFATFCISEDLVIEKDGHLVKIFQE